MVRTRQSVKGPQNVRENTSEGRTTHWRSTRPPTHPRLFEWEEGPTIRLFSLPRHKFEPVSPLFLSPFPFPNTLRPTRFLPVFRFPSPFPLRSGPRPILPGFLLSPLFPFPVPFFTPALAN